MTVAKAPKLSSKELSELKSAIGFFGRKLDNVVKKLEETFGLDLNGDGKTGKASIILVAGIAVLSFVLAVSAADVWKVGKTGAEVTINDSGDLSIDGSFTSAGAIITESTSQTVTNGQVVILTAGRNVITPSGMASAQTNIVTLANATDGYDYVIVIASGATNLLGIADSGTANLSAAFNGDATSTLTIQGLSTTFVEVSRSVN